MKKKAFTFLGFSFLSALLAVSALPVQASGSNQVTVPKSFGSSRIQDFKVIDRDTIIFEVFGMDDVVAEVYPGCQGLRFATALAIRDRAFGLSRGSTLVLPDGERCSVLSVTRALEAPEESAR